MMTNPTDEQLFELAKTVSGNAYAKFSNFHVGACALYESGKYYCGCNVENSSLGLTLCAERNALSTAIAAGEESDLLKIAIYSPQSKMCAPCGACRQWIFEFQGHNNPTIILEAEDGKLTYVSANELLPMGFKLST